MRTNEDEATKEKIADIIEYCTYMDDFGQVIFRNRDMVDEFIDHLMIDFKL